MSKPDVITQLEDTIIYESYDRLDRDKLRATYNKAADNGLPFSYYETLLAIRDMIGNTRSIDCIRAASGFLKFASKK